MGRNKMKYRYIEKKVGTHILDDKRDMIITFIESRINPNNNLKEWWCKFRCNHCGWDDGWIRISNLRQGDGCGCCAKKFVVKGINDFATEKPEKMKYLTNKEDGYKYTIGSKELISTTCPDCGDQKMMRVKDLAYNEMYNCNRCGDGRSTPEKFVYSILRDGGFDFIYQFNKSDAEWCLKYYYDFYVKDYNTIIEVNGEQHIKPNHNMYGMTTKEIQEIDEEKMNLAKENGIKHYIVINVPKTNFSKMRKEIRDKKLFDILNINEDSIDWKKCCNFASINFSRAICEYYDSQKDRIVTFKEIANYFGIADSTVSRYLNMGREGGYCTYNPKEHKRKISNIQYSNKNKKVYVYINSILKYTFQSTAELGRKSDEIFGFHMHQTTIQENCRGYRDTYSKYGITMSYQLI